MSATLASDGAVGEAARAEARAAAGGAEVRAALMQHACEHTQVEGDGGPGFEWVFSAGTEPWAAAPTMD